MTDYNETQLMEMLRKADAANDTEAARVIAGRIQSLKKVPQSQVTEPQSQHRASGMLDSFTTGAVGSFGDELTAFEAALLGRKPGGGLFDLFNYDNTFQERYNQALAAERKQNAAFKEKYPIASTLSELAGTIASGASLAKSGVTMVGRTKGFLPKVAAGGVEGAGYAAVYGAGSDESGNRLKAAVDAAPMGFGMGAGLSTAGHGLQRLIGNRTAEKLSPSVKDLGAKADAAYDKIDNLDVKYTQDAVLELVDKMSDSLKRNNATKVTDPRAYSLTKAMKKDAKSVSEIPFMTLERLRRRLWREASNKAHGDDTKTLADLAREIDNFMDGATSAQVTHGNPEQAATLIRSARSQHNQFRKAETIEEILKVAQDKTGRMGSGGNLNNNIRGGLERLLNNPKKSKWFSKEELSKIEKVVRGGKGQNMLRFLGNMSPLGNAFIGGAHLVAMMHNPALAVGSGVASLARIAAAKNTKSAAEQVARGIRGGVEVVPNQALPPLLTGPSMGLIGYSTDAAKKATSPMLLPGTLGAGLLAPAGR